MSESVDVLIVGAGPVGLFGAYYAGVRTLSVGGTRLAGRAGRTDHRDVPGEGDLRRRRVSRRSGAASWSTSWSQQAAPFSPSYWLGAPGRRPGARRREVRGDHLGRQRIECRAIVITGGIGTFTPAAAAGRPGVPRPRLGALRSRPDGLRGQHVVVVGGGDSAVDWALMLEPIAKAVTLVHRRAQFRAHPHSVELLRGSTVEMLTDAQIADVLGDPDVTEVDVNVAGEILACCLRQAGRGAGLHRESGSAAGMGHRRSPAGGTSPSTPRGATSVPGVYAAGDIVDYDGKVRLIATGFGEVATAVNNAAAYLNPSVSAFPGHLSDYAPPGATSSPTA